MGERKVLNKYFPPDFDPKKVPRLKRDPEKQICVRMMIPFSLQCNTCGEFMYRGKKFNSWKEDCIGEDYLGIRKYRFYIKCVICSQEITFKTDPEKGDYELETGASRNFESWADKQATEEEHKKAREEEEKSDNMKQLENRTLDSKIELEIMDALDEIKAVNRRHETVDTVEVLKASAARRAAAIGGFGAKGELVADEDEALIASIEFGGPKVRRLADDGESAGTDGTESSRSGVRRTGEQVQGMSSGSADGVGGQREDMYAKDRIGSGRASDGQLGKHVRAQVKRVAEHDTAGTASRDTLVVVKRKKKKQGKPADGSRGVVAKRKKPGGKHAGTAIVNRRDGATGHVPKAEEQTPVLPTTGIGAGDVGKLGGLNLLGAYASSDSDESSR